MTNKNEHGQDSPVYLYEEIKTNIKEMIKTKNMQAGSRIPNETELCELFNVSRITIRRAIKELIDEGVLEVIRGKGTFVKASKTELHLLNLKGFTEGLSTEEKGIEKEIISKALIHDHSQIAAHFSNRYTEFVELVRKVKNVDGYISLDYAYLPVELYPGIEKIVSDQSSTFQIMKEKYDAQFAKVKKEVEYTFPTSEVCHHLGINKLSPVVIVEKVICDKESLPIHYSKYYLIAERVKFFIEAEYTD